MIIVYTDETGGVQKFPLPSESWQPSRPHITVSGETEARILAGDPYALGEFGESIVFRDPQEVAAEQAAQALADEREAMRVSRFQARAALYGAGLLTTADAAIQAADEVAKLAWADAQEFRRNSPLVAAIAAQLSLTDEQLDDLFRTAATIEA